MMVPAGHARLKFAAVNVVASIALSNLTLTDVVFGTAVAALLGTVAETFGVITTLGGSIEGLLLLLLHPARLTANAIGRNPDTDLTVCLSVSMGVSSLVVHKQRSWLRSGQRLPIQPTNNDRP